LKQKVEEFSAPSTGENLYLLLEQHGMQGVEFEHQGQWRKD
jgi:hypothetical protein